MLNTDRAHKKNYFKLLGIEKNIVHIGSEKEQTKHAKPLCGTITCDQMSWLNICVPSPTAADSNNDSNNTSSNRATFLDRPEQNPRGATKKSHKRINNTQSTT